MQGYEGSLQVFEPLVNTSAAVFAHSSERNKNKQVKNGKKKTKQT